MRKKQWIICLILLGIVIGICVCLIFCGKRDEKENETDFVPFPNEEEITDFEIQKDNEAESEGDKNVNKTESNAKEKGGTKNNNPIKEGEIEGTDEEVKHPNSDVTIENDEQDKATTDEVKSDNGELPFVPF